MTGLSSIPRKQYIQELRSYLVRDHSFVEIERTGKAVQSPFVSVLAVQTEEKNELPSTLQDQSRTSLNVSFLEV